MFALIGSVAMVRVCIEYFRTSYGEQKTEKLFGMLTTLIPVVGATIIVTILSYNSYKNIYLQKYVDTDVYPVQASTFILKHIDLENAKIYNEYNYGSYMLYRDIPVFIDSRADLYAPEFSKLEDDIFMDALSAMRLDIFYEEVFEKYGITHVISYADSNVVKVIDNTNDQRYVDLYRDGKFVIYERVVSNNLEK